MLILSKSSQAAKSYLESQLALGENSSRGSHCCQMYVYPHTNSRSWGPAQTSTSQTPSLSQCWLSSSPGILGMRWKHSSCTHRGSIQYDLPSLCLRSAAATSPNPLSTSSSTPPQELLSFPTLDQARFLSSFPMKLLAGSPEVSSKKHHNAGINLLLAVNMGIRQSPGQDRIPVSNGHNYIS